MPKSKQSTLGTLGTLDQVSYCTTILVVLAFIVLHIRQKKWHTLGVFVGLILVLGVACESGACTHFKDLRVCALVAMLASYVITLPMLNEMPSSEHFANADQPVEKLTVDTAKNTSTDTTKRDPEPFSDNSPDIDTNDNNQNDDLKDKEDDNEDDNENYVDAFTTFIETYKSLTPGQIESMTNDTKDLIETQKSLMATVKGLAPIIKEGKDMMKTFGDYFGPNTANDLMTAFKKKPKSTKKND